MHKFHIRLRNQFQTQAHTLQIKGDPVKATNIYRNGQIRKNKEKIYTRKWE